MNNEPVAWLWNEDGCNLGVVLDQDKQIGKQEFQNYDIPLYTHPAKTLTDNITQIKRTSDQSITIAFTSCRSASEFEAILKKAQENG